MRKVYLGTEEISDKLRLSNDRAEIPFPVYVDSLEVEYLLIGGGGGGAPYYFDTNQGGAGGGAGEVVTGSFNWNPSTTITYRVGPFGVGRTWNAPGTSCTGGDGYDTYIQAINTAESGSGASRYGGCGYGGQSGAGFIGGGPAGSGKAGGGGAGQTENGSAGTWAGGSNPAYGGAGGDGIITDFVYSNGSPIVGAAGGGGGAGGTGFTDVGGPGGSPGGGNGSTGTTPGGNATTPGSGGGGSYQADGGDGADGLLVIRYQADREVLTGFGQSSYKVGNYIYHIDDAAALGQKTYTSPPRFLISI